jgi:hypothetical protein
MLVSSFPGSRRDVVSADTQSVIERAKRIYADRLQAVLEAQHRDRFVAIEPEPGEYFSRGHVRRGGEVGPGEVPRPPVAHHPDRASRRLSPRGHAAVNGLVDDQLREFHPARAGQRGWAGCR